MSEQNRPDESTPDTADGPRSTMALPDRSRLRSRVLFVSARPAWPLFPGYRLRTANLLRSLSEHADVDAVFVIPDDEPGPMCPPDLFPRSVDVVRVPRLTNRQAVLRWVRGSFPMPMTKVDWSAATSEVAALIDSTSYDMVFATPATVWRTVNTAKVPVTVDLDDLDDFKIRHRLGDRSNYGSGVRGLAEQVMDRVDLRRWRRLYDEVKVSARCVVVCSELDKRRLAVPHARAVPNVYPVPASRNPDVKSAHPSALFVGDLTYRPNIEALTFLHESVLPALWRTRPDFQLDVVGRNNFDPQAFDPRIHIHGTVDSVTPFLDRAWVVVAPLRSGGGTRIKILEAFAHRVPVVATTVGYEGIPATPGTQLLVADEPEAFARAMLQLASDPHLSAQLTTNGFAMFTENYTYRSLSEIMRELVRFASDTPGRYPGSS